MHKDGVLEWHATQDLERIGIYNGKASGKLFKINLKLFE